MQKGVLWVKTRGLSRKHFRTESNSTLTKPIQYTCYKKCRPIKGKSNTI